MGLIINQSLHGYRNGHQLLNSSVELHPKDSNEMLFQSDLSGSMVEGGFDSYISGYPLISSSIFVLAKTWYAEEMDRPGCVWTHSLLLDFTDLAKINNCAVLLECLRRPTVNSYDSFGVSLILELDSFESEIDRDTGLNKSEQSLVLKNLYNWENKPLLIESSTSKKYEKEIFKIWSDQWPRLRRNFTFTTGALNFKKLNDKAFCFQVIPKRNFYQALRNAESYTSLNLDILENKDISDKWIVPLLGDNVIELKRFLWSYGADVDGIPKNYPGLISLYLAIQDKSFSLDNLFLVIKQFFDKPKDARYFKKVFFGENSSLAVDEKTLLKEIVVSEISQCLVSEDLLITDRVALLYIENRIDHTFLEYLVTNDMHGLIKASIWEKIVPTTELVIKMINVDSNLVDTFILHGAEFIYDPTTWKIPTDLQLKIIDKLTIFPNSVDWQRIIFAILDARSEVILSIFRNHDESLIFLALEWLNIRESSVSLIEKFSIIIAKEPGIVKSWVRLKNVNLNKNVHNFLMNYLKPNIALQVLGSTKLFFESFTSVERWESDRRRNTVAMQLLGIALEDKNNQSSKIIETTFPLIYYELGTKKIREEIWDYVSRDRPFEDPDQIDFFLFVPYFKVKRKKFAVSSAENDKRLIVTVANNFIEYGRSDDLFLRCFKSRREFGELVFYLSTFDKGLRILRRIANSIRDGKLVSSTLQAELLQRYSSN